MMFLLSLDITHHRLRLRFAHRERPIARLPRKGWNPLRLHPFRRTLLHFLDHVTHGNGAAKGEQDMHVIVRAASLERGTLEIIQDADEIGVQVRANGGLDDGLAMFGAVDKVDEDFGEGLGHGELRPFRAGLVLGGRVPRALPWADEWCPFGAGGSVCFHSR